ncbi:MAG: AgmX/PglI C-terminal domain-containing protein [Polyangiaceae bacterium]
MSRGRAACHQTGLHAKGVVLLGLCLFYGSATVGCRREKTEAKPLLDDATACAEGNSAACVRRLGELEASLSATLSASADAAVVEQLEQRSRVAAALCRAGDCAARWRSTLGDGTAAAEEAWKALCNGDPSANVPPNRSQPLVGLADAEPSAALSEDQGQSCALLAELTRVANAAREKCLAGTSSACQEWLDLVMVEDPARASLVLLPRELERRGLTSVVDGSKEKSVRTERGKTRILRLHFDIYVRRSLGHDPRPGECTPFFAGCHDLTDKQVTERRRSAELKSLRVTTKSGELDKAAVTMAIEPVLDCYRTGLLQNPNLVGKVSLRATVDNDGHLWNAVSDASTIIDSTVIGCVLDAVVDWQLPRDLHGQSTSIELTFEPAPR